MCSKFCWEKSHFDHVQKILIICRDVFKINWMSSKLIKRIQNYLNTIVFVQPDGFQKVHQVPSKCSSKRINWSKMRYFFYLVSLTGLSDCFFDEFISNFSGRVLVENRVHEGNFGRTPSSLGLGRTILRREKKSCWEKSQWAKKLELRMYYLNKNLCKRCMKSRRLVGSTDQAYSSGF